MGDSERDLFPGALEMMILQILRRGPSHGYALVQSIKQLSADLLQVEEGSLYPALHRMTQAGWLRDDWGASENNRRARYYSITAAGRKQLAEEEKDWAELTEAVARVLQFA